MISPEDISKHFKTLGSIPGIVHISIVTLSDSKHQSHRPMTKDNLIDKLFNMSLTHGISDVKYELMNYKEMMLNTHPQYEVELNIYLEKGIDNITPEVFEALDKMNSISCWWDTIDVTNPLDFIQKI